MKKLIILLLVFSLGINLSKADNNESQALDTVILQLKWKHQFQFAGYYAAVEKGYYREAGLFVKILETNSGNEAIPSVVKGIAQFGTATSDLLLARNSGFPVVLLANIFQHSPHVFLANKEDNVGNIHDIAGKTIMVEEHAAEILAYLRSEQISINELEIIPHIFSPEPLINKEVFAISAYSTDEPFLLKESNIEYNIFNPRSSGIDFYGDVLFTSETEISENPERVKKFLDASLKGWQYALENEDEIIELIYDNYSKRHSKEHLKFEAEQTKRLIMDDVVEIGYMNKDRWQRIGEIYSELDMLPKSFSMDGFIYERNPKPDYKIAYFTIFIILLIISVISLIAIRFYRLNKKLHAESQVRKENEKQLSILEERYRNLTENAPFPVLITTLETGKILYLNQQASEKFQINKQYALNRYISEFYVNPSKREEIIKQLNNQGFIKEVEFLMKTAAGEEFWALVSSDIINFDNKPALFSAVLDISDRKELENELRLANVEKDKFFSIIAHDLKGPIGTFSKFIEKLVESGDRISEERKTEILIQLQKSSQITFELLENLLMWALTQKNEIKYNPTLNNLSEIINSNVSLFKTISKSKELRLIVECDSSLIFNFDKDMINTVIRNLLNNAIKYSEPNNQIKITAILQKEELLFGVEDSGMGMGSDDLSNLFRLDTRKSSKIGTNGEKGTGLGLILSADFIQKHGGKLWAESKEGEGSKFYFTLPNKID
jgi:PAS domain S-box-containing protein